MYWFFVIIAFLLASIKTSKPKYQKVSVVIPAYNEEETVAKVIDVVKKVSFVDEIIVVNDGSSDDTEGEALRAGAIVINHETNKGKGEALYTGYMQSECDIIAFIDADIYNLTSKKVEAIIKPILLGKTDITKTKFDFSQITSKPNTNANQLSAKLLGLEITDNQSGIYHAGEYINFNIDVLARKKYDQLRFRFELRYADDIPVGTVPDIELGPMDSSQKKRFHMRFLTSGLTRGKYTVCLVLFERNEYGTCADQDLIFNAFQFEIKDSEAITWNTSTWGHIRLPDMIVSCDEV